MTKLKPKAFELLLRVRYAECDPQNVVFNARYADYADLAATEFMRALIGGYQALTSQGLDNQVVNLNISWQNSARFDDILCLSVHVSKVGNTSFTMQIDMLNWQTQQAVASAEIVYVMVDSLTFEKKPVPNEFKATLLKGAAGRTMNLAGVELP
jgi:acyl-CoA thioester hydrolase